MSMFSTAIQSAMGTLQRVAGATVTYHRGDSSTGEVTAVPGSTTFDEVGPDGGIVTHSTSHDWIVEAKDLVIDGQVITPQARDVVKRVVGAVRMIYQVMDPPYRPSDHDHTRLRIHTKQVGQEAL